MRVFLFAACVGAAGAALATVEETPQFDQCPEILQRTCLPHVEPVLHVIRNSSVDECCDACVSDKECVSWTLRTDSKVCHLHGSFHDPEDDAPCSSGQIPGRAPSAAPAPAAPTDAKNVLLIVVDDLRPQLNCYNVSVCNGGSMYTPNIDSLAARSLVFRNAYNQYSVCSPSRNSFLSGRRPDSTLTWNFKDSFRSAPGGEDWIALPEYFKDHGYNTSGAGKTYHMGHPPNFDEPRSWSMPYAPYNQGLGFCGDHCACNITDPQYFSDDGYANRTIEVLQSHKDNNIGKRAVRMLQFSGMLCVC